MGFGMCGTRSKDQTVQQALDSLASGVRFFLQTGAANSPHGGSGTKGPGWKACMTSDNTTSITAATRWFKANATNSGGASAICMLTAQYLYKSLGSKVPVGAVESW